ncbi:hypothetical protein [Paenibacillus rigui]|uniref:Uncharacterized protein n=1 Tax=Paenibacillus rigui TaxID=554312 RepID=A0A229UTL5_9BACL|nr:hypothetical protein [Paenibacillus rigui]OXM86768.1 hypothetical protein CF651_07915 [Paenibacillus rigui]
MAKGVVDVYISKELDDNTAILYVDCAMGIPHNLNTIRSGTVVVLQRDEVKRDVRLIQDSDKESSYNYMEISPDNARKLGIRDGMRFILTYDANDKTIQMRHLASCRAIGMLYSDPRKNYDGVISIGYALLSWLGINATETYISLTKGSLTKKLKLSIPENELEEYFRLSPSNLRAFGLLPRKKHKLEYSQTTKTLRIVGHAAVASAKKVKTGSQTRRK